eukprot:5047599-Heterocapsa_arctica.AAC.1
MSAEKEFKEKEGRASVLRRGTVTTTKQEIEERTAMHATMRELRCHCMAGRGRKDPHRFSRDDREEDHMSTADMNHGSLKSRTGGGGRQQAAAEDEVVKGVCGECGPMLVAVDAREDNSIATVVPAMGPARPWIAMDARGDNSIAT